MVVLLTAAGLFTRSLTALLRLDLGFDPQGVVTFGLSIPEGKYDTKRSNGLQGRLFDERDTASSRLTGDPVPTVPALRTAVALLDRDTTVDGD